MAVVIREEQTAHYGNLRSTYRTLALSVDGCDLTVMTRTPDAESDARSYVTVVVENAAHRAWRSMGREFPSLDAAIAKYRDRKVVSGLEFVKSHFAV